MKVSARPSSSAVTPPGATAPATPPAASGRSPPGSSPPSSPTGASESRRRLQPGVDLFHRALRVQDRIDAARAVVLQHGRGLRPVDFPAPADRLRPVVLPLVERAAVDVADTRLPRRIELHVVDVSRRLTDPPAAQPQDQRLFADPEVYHPIE